jgi:hypothetical protein
MPGSRASAFMPKPVDVPQLLQHIGRLLEPKWQYRR